MNVEGEAGLAEFCRPKPKNEGCHPGRRDMFL